MKAAIDVSEWAWLSSSTTLFVKQVEGTDLAHRLQFPILSLVNKSNLFSKSQLSVIFSVKIP